MTGTPGNGTPLKKTHPIDRAIRMGFLLGTVTLGMVAGPLTPVAAAGAALGVGQFGWTELWNRQQAGTNEAQVRKSGQTLTLLSDPTSMGGSIGILTTC